MWTYRPTGGALIGRTPADATSGATTLAIAGHRLPVRPDHAPAIRRPAALIDLLLLAAPWQELPGVARAQEYREPGHGMAEERGRDPAGDAGHPATDEAGDQRHREQVAVPAGRPQARRERIDQGLDGVGRARVHAGPEQDPEDRAAERDLVDERRRDRVDERARIRPDVREADPPVAVIGDRERQTGTDRRVQEAVEDRQAAVTGPEQELPLRLGMDEQDPGDEREPEAVPGDAAAERRRPAVDRFVVFRGAEALRLEAEHDEKQREPRGDQALEGREPLLHGLL